MEAVDSWTLKQYVALTTFLARLRDEEGQAMPEYGLLVALIAVVVIIAVTAIGTNLGTRFQEIADSLLPGGE